MGAIEVVRTQGSYRRKLCPSAEDSPVGGEVGRVESVCASRGRSPIAAGDESSVLVEGKKSEWERKKGASILGGQRQKERVLGSWYERQKTGERKEERKRKRKKKKREVACKINK